MRDLGDEAMERTFWQFTTLISLFERNPMFTQNERYLKIPEVYDGGGQGNRTPDLNVANVALSQLS